MHQQFLLEALDQAKLGRGMCSPNPSVGAVAVQNGQIIARAWHKGAGTLHAEPLLLAQLPPKMPGIDLYVTLEPCNHWGKTPPCVDAIVDYGVDRVFFAYADPNPIVSKNNSVEILNSKGITATHIQLPEVDNFYKSYSYWLKTGKPWVTVKMAQSFDGKIGYINEDRVILSNSLCAEFTHQQRASCDIILTTAKTITCDNPQLNVRLKEKNQAKPLAIIDSNLNLNSQAKVFSTAKECLIYYKNEINFTEQRAFYGNSRYYPMPLKNGKLNLEAIIYHLGEQGYHDVWVEAGGALFSALHADGLVNSTYLYLVPTSLGPEAVTAYQGLEIFKRKHTVSWQAMNDNMIACLEWLE